MTDNLSTESVLNLFPNRSTKRIIANPGSWPQEQREAATRHIGGEPSAIDPYKTLAALEHAIQALDMVRMSQIVEPDELATTLRELRAVRVEHLKEIG